MKIIDNLSFNLSNENDGKYQFKDRNETFTRLRNNNVRIIKIQNPRIHNLKSETKTSWVKYDY
jgi:hypothetical protein